MKKAFLLILFANSLCISGWSHDHDHKDEKGIWEREKIEAAGIKIFNAGGGYIRNYIEATGEICVHPSGIAYVTPNVNGIVKEIYKIEGEPAQENEILAVIESMDLAKAKSDYLIAVKKLFLKQKIYEQEESVRHLCAEQDYLLAKADFEEALIQHELAKQSLYTFGLEDGEINEIEYESPATFRFYNVRAPLSGKIFERNISLGEQIGESHKAFTMVSERNLIARLNIPSCEMSWIEVGQPVTLICQNGQSQQAKLSSLNALIDTENRSAKAIVQFKSQSISWIPGSFVKALIEKEHSPVSIIVSHESILDIKGENYLVAEDNGHFVLRPVKIGKKDVNSCEILMGLSEGECYVSKAFLLKADYEKDEVEHDD